MSNKEKLFVFAVLFVFFLLLFTKACFAAPSINEFVAKATVEWVEFSNASESAEFLKEYYLDDDTDFNSDSGSSAKKFLTSLNTQNPYFPYFEMSSFLNNAADWVVLFDPNGNIVDSFYYSSDFGENVSMGRSPDGTGSFVVLAQTTQGLPNSSAKPTDTPTPTPTNTPTTTPTTSPTPTPTSTVKPTSTPTTIATKSPTLKPTTTPTVSPTQTTQEESSMVLGIQDNLSPSPTTEENMKGEKKDFNRLSLVFVGSGVCFVLYSVFAFLRQKRLNKNATNV